jgi:hypothetical protein
METEFGKMLPNLNNRFFPKLNPNPFSDYLGKVEEVWCFATQHRQQRFTVERPVHAPPREIDFGFCAPLFGSALEP